LVPGGGALSQGTNGGLYASGNGGRGSIVVTYNTPATTKTVPGGGWVDVDQIYIKDSNIWKPVISRSVLDDQRSLKWLTAGTYSWTVPSDVSRAKIMVYGAGGSGTGGAGGAGGYAEKYLTVTPNSTYSITVGAGGVDNAVGQASNFNGAIIANGGGRGNAAGVATDAGGAGGSASGGDLNLTGAAGTAGQAVYSYSYWWWGWGYNWGWGGYNYYNYNYGYYNYNYGGYYGNGWWGGYYGWGWPWSYRLSGYNLGIPGTGYDGIGGGAVGPDADNPTGSAGAVFVLF
jgi:hypothetical protein